MIFKSWLEVATCISPDAVWSIRTLCLYIQNWVMCGSNGKSRVQSMTETEVPFEKVWQPTERHHTSDNYFHPAPRKVV